MNSSKRRNKLYNYLVNTYGLSEEVILRYTHERIEKVLNKHLEAVMQLERFERLILNRVTEIIKNGFISRVGYWSSQDSFDDYLKSVIRSLVLERLNEQYSIDVKIVRKGQKGFGSQAGPEDIS